MLRHQRNVHGGGSRIWEEKVEREEEKAEEEEAEEEVRESLSIGNPREGISYYKSLTKSWRDHTLTF